MLARKAKRLKRKNPRLKGKAVQITKDLPKKKKGLTLKELKPEVIQLKTEK